MFELLPQSNLTPFSPPAPVRAVDLEQRGDTLKCSSSEDIYPKPESTWSSSNRTEPNSENIIRLHVCVNDKNVFQIYKDVFSKTATTLQTQLPLCEYIYYFSPNGKRGL